MKIKEIILEEYRDLESRLPQKVVYTQIRHALRAAEKRGKKVVKTAGGYYKTAPLDDQSPALEPNPDRSKQVEEIKKFIEFLHNNLRLKYRDKNAYRRFVYKYGKDYEVEAKIAQLNRDLRNLPYAREVDPDARQELVFGAISVNKDGEVKFDKYHDATFTK